MKPVGHIISLKFAPGLKKEFSVIGERLRSNGFDIRYYLADGYRFIGNNYPGTEYITKSRNVNEVLYDSARYLTCNKNNEIFPMKHNIRFVLFYNPHILNLFIARFLKRKRENIKTILYLHDPYKHDKSAYGLAKNLYISLVEWMQKVTARYVDDLIFPSNHSYKLFCAFYKHYRGKVHLAPLLVPDQRKNNNKKREIFSIVGTYNNATGHDTFIDLVNYLAGKGYNYKFALISSSDISHLLNKLSEDGRQIVEIINNKIIDDSEINDIIARSYAVFRLDREVTQSGVIPVSYMNSTPIISRDIPGLSQHVKHGHNGYLIPYDCSPGDIINAMDQVRTNFALLAKNARKSFDDVWAEWNFEKYYDWLLREL